MRQQLGVGVRRLEKITTRTCPSLMRDPQYKKNIHHLCLCTRRRARESVMKMPHLVISLTPTPSSEIIIIIFFYIQMTAPATGEQQTSGSGGISWVHRSNYQADCRQGEWVTQRNEYFATNFPRIISLPAWVWNRKENVTIYAVLKALIASCNQSKSSGYSVHATSLYGVRCFREGSQ
jgi:hypothetical protein